MQTVREVVEQNKTTADIYEIRNAKPTGIFYYDPEKLINDFGGHLVDETFIIKGLGGHDAIYRIWIKKAEK